MRRIAILALALTGCGALVLLSGCGGGDGTVQPNGLGSVSGRVLAGLENPVGFGGVEILLNTQTNPAVTVARGTSDANGFFTVQDVPPGTYNVVVEVRPETGFVVPPWAQPVEVTVLANQNTDLQDPITVVDENNLPPDPPEQ